MKDIEINSKSEADALETVCRELRLPGEAFEIVESKPSDSSEAGASSAALVIKIRLKKDVFRDIVRDRVMGLLKNMGVFAEVRVRATEDFLNADIYTKQGSILIGRRGETLDALQHLLNRMICRNDRDMPMILLDVEGYRAKIQRRLKKIALTAAEKAQKTGQPSKMEPMSPHDRKYIHKLLSEIEGVTTYSMGREGQRYVVIAGKSTPGQFVGEDEELLPEFLDDPALIKRERPLFQKKHFQNTRTKLPANGNDMNDLLIQDNEEEKSPGN
ncbi:KH domain-containing protein [Candidatus Sumerlaeota bacterium]|nr:KH domain-containing protein [Candidatus Sumerlaeota bacterium]